jgi:hypothetical protein
VVTALGLAHTARNLLPPPPPPPQVFEIFTNYNRTLRPDGRAEVTNRIVFRSTRCGPCGCVHSLWSNR